MSTPPVPREQFLVISALGANPMELTNVLCRAANENRCAVVSTRLTRHGECSALALETRPQALPYVAYVSAAFRPDILNELCQFFIDHRVELESLTCDTYQAPQTGGTMLNATLTVTLPAGTQISWLRDQFLDFADALNLDALIEPWRPQNP